MIVGKHTMQVFQGDLKNLISLSKSMMIVVRDK